jgi:lipopolysaccharide biosynthesis glycosyltransferase
MSPHSELEPIVLICAADNNYAMPLAVTVRSALANLSKNRKIALFILDGGIQKKNKEKITKSLKSEQIDISWVQPKQEIFQNLVLTRHVTIPTYYRLIITDILPSHFKKAIYLDSDMVVTGDLAELWDIDIKDNYILAVQDDVQLYVSMSDGLKNYQELGISPDGKYFNAGLLVINVEKWRAENIGKKVLEHIQRYRGIVRDDQDGLNAILSGKWGELHPKWNVMPQNFEYSSWKESPHTEHLYEELIHHPGIIHYTNTPKPWHAGLKAECTHPKKHLFFHYLDMTAWSGWRDTFLRRLWRKFMKVTSLSTTKL